MKAIKLSRLVFISLYCFIGNRDLMRGIELFNKLVHTNLHTCYVCMTTILSGPMTDMLALNGYFCSSLLKSVCVIVYHSYTHIHNKFRCSKRAIVKLDSITRNIYEYIIILIISCHTLFSEIRRKLEEVVFNVSSTRKIMIRWSRRGNREYSWDFVA